MRGFPLPVLCPGELERVGESWGDHIIQVPRDSMELIVSGPSMFSEDTPQCTPPPPKRKGSPNMYTGVKGRTGGGSQAGLLGRPFTGGIMGATLPKGRMRAAQKNGEQETCTVVPTAHLPRGAYGWCQTHRHQTHSEWGSSMGVLGELCF